MSATPSFLFPQAWPRSRSDECMTRLDIYNVLIIMSFALLDSLMMKLIAVVVFLAVYTSTG